ncbi:MAG: hypothetical protein QM598_05935 [Protaetiibacter sp.]
MSDEAPSIRDDLQSIGSNLSRTSREYDRLLEQRGEFVARARREGMTWREIAGLLDMTEHGLVKSQRSWEKRVAGRK